MALHGWAYGGSGGGGGTPGGSAHSTQINSSGSFGGVGPGTSGYVLTSGGASADPSFQPPAAGGYASSVTATAATTQNNYSPTGYTAGTTNRLLLAAASGGSTITGLVAAPDGWTVLIVNTSATDIINFSHLSGSSTSTNQFSCAQGVTSVLQPLAATLCIYVASHWVFA